MQCSVKDCGRAARYKSAQLCQKHYFRLRRNGSVELSRTAQERVVTPNGYVRVHAPTHPLRDKNGYVFEHRMVVWEQRGEACGVCEICHKPETWKTCHVDHKDDDRQNNRASNLRILCRGCNVKRGFKPESYASVGRVGLIEFAGLRLTPAQWARDPRVKVTGRTIISRKLSGMSDAEALFAEKVTHKARASQEQAA